MLCVGIFSPNGRGSVRRARDIANSLNENQTGLYITSGRNIVSSLNETEYSSSLFPNRRKVQYGRDARRQLIAFNLCYRTRQNTIDGMPNDKISKLSYRIKLYSVFYNNLAIF